MKRTSALSLLVLSLLCGCGDEVSSTGAGGSGGSGGSGGAGGSGAGDPCSTEVQPSLQVAITDRGAVLGVPDAGTMSFRGIPFAAPPVGPRRWAPPEPPACWQDTRDTTSFGPKCPQYDLSSGQPVAVGNEDCLSLNVWTPAAGETSSPRPVLFFIHGGGNIQGSSSQLLQGGAAIYGGQHLASEHDAVVVTINYRLGALGFLASSELQAESANGTAGNYAMMDMLAALQWVQRNISAFGGDPQRVMVFGESAGGVNVCTLLATPSASGLFHAALVQSGACVLNNMAAVVSTHDARIDETSCGAAADRLACLRELSSTALLSELPGTVTSVFSASLGAATTSFGPIVDGTLVTESPLTAMEAGNHIKVPVVFGSNAEELAVLITTTVSSETEYADSITAAFAAAGQPWVDAVLAAYPAASYPTPQDALVAVFTDLRFSCPTRAYARAAVSGGSQAVYRYWFSRQAETAMGPLAASHGIELLYVFGSMDDIPLYTPAPADAQLSTSMKGYWARFARAADPNGGNASNWPSYNATTDPVLVLDSPVASVDNLKAAECDMWDKFYLGQQP